jgi:hypothetical protein
MRFLTLGSAPRMRKNIDESLRVLKERIKRLTPLKLVRDGYASPGQLHCQYSGKDLNSPIRFDYLKIKTTEGPNGVFHILYFGDFIPQAWLKAAWLDITGTCRSVYIRACAKDTYNDKRLAKYIVSQYCVGQSDFLAYSWSWGWVYPGFVKDWKELKRICRDFDNPLSSPYQYVCFPIRRDVLFSRWNKWLAEFQNRTEFKAFLERCIDEDYADGYYEKILKNQSGGMHYAMQILSK